MALKRNNIAKLLEKQYQAFPGVSFECPSCGEWMRLVKEQFYGKVPIVCKSFGCNFQETTNMAAPSKETRISGRRV